MISFTHHSDDRLIASCTKSEWSWLVGFSTVSVPIYMRQMICSCPVVLLGTREAQCTFNAHDLKW